ncbi:MAG: LysE family translocator [Caulobacterales bacterium]|nr:LysE family translocator [Caulobacterales bacterium]
MISAAALVAFALVCFGLAVTPGPNMVYLVSRSICQGRAAGYVSLAGTATGFVIYMFATALGLTALLMAVPLAYDALRFAGAAYLAWLAWQALKPGGRSPFQVRTLAPDSPRRLYVMGMMTNLLNPKAAMLYLSLLPQFIDPARGDIFWQSITLSSVQIAVSMCVNGAIIAAAGSIAGFLAGRPRWMVAQRWLMGTVLGGLAVRMATEARR